MAHPLRRGGLVLPPARLDVTVNDTVVAIMSVFFAVGIIVGIIAVVAMSALRAGRRGDRGDPGGPPGYESPGPAGPTPSARRDDTGPDGRPRWPGDADNGFSAG